MKRALSLLTALLFAAFPVRAALSDPSIPLRFKLGWVVLFLVGLVLPAWRTPLVLVLVPLVPWVPFGIKGVPHGIVHFVVLSQALPWLVRPGGSGRPWTGPVAWCWLLLVAVAIASLTVQQAAYATVFESGAAYFRELAAHFTSYGGGRPGPSLENMLAATMAFATGSLVFAMVRTSPLSRARLLASLGGTAVIVALIGFWQAQSGTGLRAEWRVHDPFITRINATFSDPNALAAFLAAMVPLLFALAGRGSGRARVWWAGGAALVAVGLVMTAGRIAAVAGLAGLCVLAVIVIRTGLDRLDQSPFLRRTFRRAVLTMAALVVAGLVALTLAGTTLDARHATQHSYLDTWLYTFNLRRPFEETAKGRVDIWRAAVRMIEDRPGFGLGVGRIYRVFGYYARDLTTLPEGMTFSAHSTFLNIGAELGLVGLAVWLALLALSFREVLVRSASGTQESAETRWIDAGLIGALSTLTVTMTTGDRAILYEDLVLLGAVTGLIAFAGFKAATSTPRREAMLRHGAIGLAAIVLLSLPPRILAERGAVRLDHVTFGLHHVELSRHGTRFRWTTDRALFYLPPTATSLKLRLRSIAPFNQTVQVLVRGALVFKSELGHGSGIEIRPVLPPVRSGGYQRIEILVSPTWRPPTDARELGVMADWDWR
jgi:O-antigen ligase